MEILKQFLIGWSWKYPTLKFIGITKVETRGKCKALDTSIIKEWGLKKLIKLSLQEAGKGSINQR